MNLIGHETKANQRDAVDIDVVSEQIEIDHAIGNSIENKGPPMATLRDMVRYIHGNKAS